MTDDNTRRYKRFKASYLLKFRLAVEPTAEYFYNITDLSASGLRFWSDKFFTEGSLAQVSFIMPPLNRTFEILGRIVRTRRYQAEDPKEAPIYYIAIGFLDLPAKDQAQVNDFIEKIAQSRGAREFVDMPEKINRRVEVGKDTEETSYSL